MYIYKTFIQDFIRNVYKKCMLYIQFITIFCILQKFTNIYTPVGISTTSLSSTSSSLSSFTSPLCFPVFLLQLSSTILTNISHCEAYLILNIDFYISWDSVQQKLKLFSEEYFFSYLPLHFIKSCHIICDHKPPYLIIPHHMPSHFIVSYFILSCYVTLYFILSHLILSNYILLCVILS